MTSKLTKKNKVKGLHQAQNQALIQKQQKQQQQLPYYLCQEKPIFIEQKYQTESYPLQKQALIQADLAKCQDLLKNYINAQSQTASRIQQLTNFTFAQGINFDSGLRFYTCKSIIFNQYLICLKMYELFRLNAVDFTTGPGFRLYQRLLYLKTLILKLSPVQKKLEYQKNKLLKKGQKIRIKQFNDRQQNKTKDDLKQSQQEDNQDSQQDGEQDKEKQEDDNQDEQDKLAYRPSLKNLIVSKDKNKSEKQKQGKYVAPKQSAVLPVQQKAKRREERQQQRRKAFLLRKFRGDIESGDQAEQKDMLEGIDPRFKKRYEQKMRFEEENFTRLNETKKEKFLKKQIMKNRFNNSLNNELKQIELIRELVDDENTKTKRPKPISVKKKAEGDSKPKPQKKRKLE